MTQNPLETFLSYHYARQDLPQIWTDVTDRNWSGVDHLLKSGVVAQAFEIDLEPRARDVEITAAFDRFPQVFERARLVANHRVRAGDVIPRERVVGPFGQALRETRRDVAEGVAGVVHAALPRVGAGQLLIDFDQHPLFEHVVALAGEDYLAVILRDRVVVTALQVIDVAEPRVGADDLHTFVASEVLLLRLDRPASHLFGPFVFAQIGQAMRQGRRDPTAFLRVIHRQLVLVGGFAEQAFADVECAAQSGMNETVVRGERERALERPDGVVHAIHGDEGHSQRAVTVREHRAQLDRLLQILHRAIEQRGHRQKLRLERERVAHEGVSLRVIRIERNGLFEELDRLVQPCAAAAEQLHSGAGASLIGFDHLGLPPGGGFQLAAVHVEVARQLVNDLVLQVEDLAHPPVDLHGLEHLAVGDLDEAGGDAQHLADALVSAADDPAGAHLAADARGELLVEVGVVFGVPPAQRLVNQLAPDDGHPLDVLQIGGHGLGDADAEPVVFRAFGDVVETQHGDALLSARDVWSRAEAP